MKFALTLLLGFGCFATLQAQDLSVLKLEKHSSSKGKYSITFPAGKVTTSEETIKTQIGDIQFVTDTGVKGKGAGFLVCYNDYPASVMNIEPRQLMEGVSNGNQGKDGTLLKRKEIEFGTEKLPGLEVLIKKSSNLYMRNLIVMKGPRTYQVMAVGTEQAVQHAKVNEYYQSFEITK